MPVPIQGNEATKENDGEETASKPQRKSACCVNQ